MDVQQLMGIHRKAISCASGDESSLSDSVRDEGTLDFIVMRAESHDTPEERASEYLWCIANWHPFVEGNKRTAWLAAQASLGGKVLVYSDAAECDRAVRRMAAGMCESEQALESVGCRLEPFEGDPVEYSIRTQMELLRKLSERAAWNVIEALGRNDTDMFEAVIVSFFKLFNIEIFLMIGRYWLTLEGPVWSQIVISTTQSAR